jgi:hypothetical protein
VIAGGMSVLFTSTTGTTALDDSTVVVQGLPAGGRTIVQRNAYGGRYLPSGHLLYVHENALFAEPFDAGRLSKGFFVYSLERDRIGSSRRASARRRPTRRT